MAKILTENKETLLTRYKPVISKLQKVVFSIDVLQISQLIERSDNSKNPDSPLVFLADIIFGTRERHNR